MSEIIGGLTFYGLLIVILTIAVLLNKKFKFIQDEDRS